MKSYYYVEHIKECRLDLWHKYKEKGLPKEPVFTMLWHNGITGEILVPVFINELDKDKERVSQLKYPHRDL